MYVACLRDDETYSVSLPGFVESENKKKLKCTICERYNAPDDWMGRDNDKKHLASKNHIRNADAGRLRTATIANIHVQNSAINSELGQLEIPTANAEPADSGPYIPSAAEEEMWDQYNTNGATFSAGNDPTSDELMEQVNLARQADEFGRWNAASIARNLGFVGDDSEIPALNQHDEEDAILCDG
jgi:hypothetical protein